MASSKPCLIIYDEDGNAHDYTEYISDEGLKPTNNGMDSDGAGRDILTGYMYRSMICQKQKWTVALNRIPADIIAQLASDLAQEYFDATTLDFLTNTENKRNYYNNTFTCGTQRYKGGEVVYDGCTFDMIER